METWHGIINSPNDALLLFEACRLGHMKRIQRRLSDSERIAYVKSGAIFLWDEEESGIKRWTDGKHWSPSRINGSFLIYREVEPRKSKIPGMDDRIEYVIKEDGLTKKAISITTSDGRRQHLVSYYLRADLNQRILDPPSSIPSFSELVISTEIYPEFMP
ncbi:camp independent regulatory protein, partial [Fimicolochytrium jonesii]|uniref:camp independent regulatory protein n=1 Tax=Fimicolochytrium jonesii TaxID=1396493 RepID=UPI0022FE1A13